MPIGDETSTASCTRCRTARSPTPGCTCSTRSSPTPRNPSTMRPGRRYLAELDARLRSLR